MSDFELIGISDDLRIEAESFGLRLGREYEPDAQTLAGRYHYEPDTGHIIGPRGKVLTPQPNNGVWRNNVWHDGRAVSVMIGRLAFAIQYGRWPVGIAYRNGDTSDHRAANLTECVSVALKRARKSQDVYDLVIWEGLPTPTGLDVSDYAGAWSGGRYICDEMADVWEALEYDRLTDRERSVLQAASRRLENRYNRIVNRIRRVENNLRGFSTGHDKPTTEGRLRRRVRVKGPSKAIRRFARLGSGSKPRKIGLRRRSRRRA